MCIYYYYLGCMRVCVIGQSDTGEAIKKAANDR